MISASASGAILFAISIDQGLKFEV